MSHRRVALLPLVALLLSLVYCSPATAIVIEASGRPVVGYLVREDENKLTIRVQTPEGEEKTSDYLRSKIKIVHQIDSKRLESLSRDNPKAYRDYADELVRQETDPEARYMARRLYLIAAYLDPQQYGAGSLIRLSSLASNQAEARRCRALAYLIDLKADDNLLKVETIKPKQLNAAQASALQEYVKALQYYRAGKIKPASELARRKGMEQIFGMASDKLDQKMFLRLCAEATTCGVCRLKGETICSGCSGRGLIAGERCTTCNGRKALVCEACSGRGVNLDLSDSVLRLLLRAELWATDRLLGIDATAQKPDNKSWSSVMQRRQTTPVLSLSLETITEFDPRKCHYRNGIWLVP